MTKTDTPKPLTEEELRAMETPDIGPATEMLNRLIAQARRAIELEAENERLLGIARIAAKNSEMQVELSRKYSALESALDAALARVKELEAKLERD